MRVMVFSKANEAQPMEPTPEMVEAFAAMDGFIEALVQAGVFVAAAGLKPTAQSKRVLFDGRGGAAAIDGPFTETKEVVVGFSIWEVKDMDEALAWAKRIPAAMAGEVEIRPFMEAADLEGFVSPEEMKAPRDGERGKLGVA
ncbi:YciI family protein [Vitreimonas flagellata]|uniref:YciI family protein n=1 Tax=Vitreimonas flagellata TaxID=2560861 RepID=UPI0010752D8F|nr:YciI family protein [Vitreimonas flagellata]